MEGQGAEGGVEGGRRVGRVRVRSEGQGSRGFGGSALTQGILVPKGAQHHLGNISTLAGRETMEERKSFLF